MGLPILASISLLVFVAVTVGMWPLLRLLRKCSILDHPNERSSHVLPTPKGAGALLVPVIVVGWVAVAWYGLSNRSTYEVYVIGGLALALGVVSWVDDLKGLSPVTRLIAQTAAVAVASWVLADGELIFGGLMNFYVEKAFIILIWVWFINLFNFMDGIDGISAVELLVVNLGLVILSSAVSDLSDSRPYAVVMLVAATGFLFWNWHPARIFLGDVGSAPLGFLLGWQLILIAKSGAWAAALILPGYYLADATLTLVRRILRGEKAWQAHRDHFYQIAVRGVLDHQGVALRVLYVGLILIVLSVLSVIWNQYVSLFLSVLVIAGLLVYFTIIGAKSSE